MNAAKKQKLFAATGAAVIAIYDTLTSTPTVLFSQDEEDDFYWPPAAWETLDDSCDVNYMIQASALVTAGAHTYGAGKADLEADMESIAVPPSRNWFRKYLLHVHEEENWVQQMKMTRKMFFCLVKHLEPSLKRETKWNHVASEIKVGASVYRLVSAASVEEVGEKFGLDDKVAQGVIEQTVKAINSDLGYLITWPTVENMEKASQGFRNSSSLPNCCGAIDGCHIEITSTNPNYKNKEGYCSVILQAVCDTQSKFFDVICGWPGRTHQTRVLRNSKFFERVKLGEVLSGQRVPINSGFFLRQYIVGDDEYPHLPWLMTPYVDGPTLMYSRKCFNRQHEKARMHITEAFSILKSTFKLLGRPMDDDLDFLPQLIFSACILHNFLINSREDDFESILDKRKLSQETQESEADPCEEDAITIRDELTEFIALWT